MNSLVPRLSVSKSLYRSISQAVLRQYELTGRMAEQNQPKQIIHVTPNGICGKGKERKTADGFHDDTQPIDFLLSDIYCQMNYYCRDICIQLRHKLLHYYYFPLSFILINLYLLCRNEILSSYIKNSPHFTKHACPFVQNEKIHM